MHTRRRHRRRPALRRGIGRAGSLGGESPEQLAATLTQPIQPGNRPRSLPVSWKQTWRIVPGARQDGQQQHEFHGAYLLRIAAIHRPHCKPLPQQRPPMRARGINSRARAKEPRYEHVDALRLVGCVRSAAMPRGGYCRMRTASPNSETVARGMILACGQSRFFPSREGPTRTAFQEVAPGD